MCLKLSCERCLYRKGEIVFKRCEGCEALFLQLASLVASGSSTLSVFTRLLNCCHIWKEDENTGASIGSHCMLLIRISRITIFHDPSGCKVRDVPQKGLDWRRSSSFILRLQSQALAMTGRRAKTWNRGVSRRSTAQGGMLSPVRTSSYLSLRVLGSCRSHSPCCQFRSGLHSMTVFQAWAEQSSTSRARRSLSLRIIGASLTSLIKYSAELLRMDSTSH